MGVETISAARPAESEISLNGKEAVSSLVRRLDVFSKIQGLLDGQAEGQHGKEPNAPFFLPLGDYHFFVGRNGKDSKSPGTKEHPLSFRLGDYFYFYRKGSNGKDSDSHWLVRRAVDDPQAEMSLWVPTIGNNGNSAVQKIEHYAWSEKGVESYDGRKASAKGLEMIVQMEQDLASGKSPKRA
ncbi:MAG: hypothetical protein Q8P26_03485 [Candidatus Levybacteria bacterium]|nr:hypothetical protein [Candidatus Levybacteria bacterium]MDZ4228454.1 hypothetical protein [Candidatus Levybacteria bacterium]